MQIQATLIFRYQIRLDPWLQIPKGCSIHMSVRKDPFHKILWVGSSQFFCSVSPIFYIFMPFENRLSFGIICSLTNQCYTLYIHLYTYKLYIVQLYIVQINNHINFMQKPYSIHTQYERIYKTNSERQKTRTVGNKRNRQENRKHSCHVQRQQIWVTNKGSLWHLCFYFQAFWEHLIGHQTCPPPGKQGFPAPRPRPQPPTSWPVQGTYLEKDKGPGLITGITQEVASSHQ